MHSTLSLPVYFNDLVHIMLPLWQNFGSMECIIVLCCTRAWKWYNQPPKSTNVLPRHFQGLLLSFRFFKVLKVFALPTVVSSTLVVSAVLFQCCRKMWTAYVCCVVHETLLRFLFRWCYQHYIWWHRMWVLVHSAPSYIF